MSSDLWPYRFAAATLTGSAHLQAGRNNQDAFALRAAKEGYAAVVCDGCSGGSRSEVGAQLGADLLAARLIERVAQSDLAAAVRAAADDVTEQLRGLAASFGAQREDWVENRLLFTVVGALGNATQTAVFAFGDGVVAVDGAVRRLGPFENNAPPYLAYRLIGADLQPNLLEVFSTSQLRSLALATDGLADLRELAELPAEDALFFNRDALRRRLWLLRKNGAVSDDATAILIRRWAEA